MSSRPDRFGRSLAVAALAWSAVAGATLPEVELEIGGLDDPRFRARSVMARLGGALGEGAELRFEALRIGMLAFREGRVACGRFSLDAGRITCRRGRLLARELPQAADLEFELEPGAAKGWLTATFGDQGRVRIDLSSPQQAEARIDGLALAPWLAPYLPPGWQAGGRVEGQLGWHDGQVIGRVQLDEGRFSNADGARAAEQLGLEVELAAALGGERRQASLTARWRQGGVYWAPVFQEGGDIRADLSWSQSRAEPAALALEVQGPGLPRLALQAGVADWPPADYSLSVERMDLARLGPTVIAPLLDPAAPDSWRLSGTVSGRLEVIDGALASVEAQPDAVRVEHQARQLGVGPVSGSIAWRGARTADSALRVAGLHWRKLAFGDFTLAVSASGRNATLRHSRIPLLDGAVVLENVRWLGGEAPARVLASAYVEPITMAALTSALELPAMNGMLSASLPSMRFEEDTLSMDGALVIGVFDGFIQATGLQLIDPLGRLPRLQADVQARNLDLGLLTDTFSFGRISGQLDTDIDGLELADWRPLRFDARLRSSAGDYPRRISQRAVENIGALGGAGAAAAIQRSFLGVFETFGYRRLGLSCRLRAGVCEMDGLPGGVPGNGFVIVEGGGVPALNVIGYNRRVDWDELVARIAAVIESNARPVVQ